jgi:hypothetical protein
MHYTTILPEREQLEVGEARRVMIVVIDRVMADVPRSYFFTGQEWVIMLSGNVSRLSVTGFLHSKKLALNSGD